MKLYTLDEIFERAIGAAFLSPEFKAKDEAMYQTEDVMRRINNLNDATYLYEDDLLVFAKYREMKYDINGNVI